MSEPAAIYGKAKQLDIFYNTTNLQGCELAEKREKASGLTGRILQFFIQNPGILYTPFDVQNEMNLYTIPITSIRRAMTTLSSANPPLLIKTDYMRRGLFGTLNHCWKLA